MLQPFHLQGPQPNPNAFRLSSGSGLRRPGSSLEILPQAVKSQSPVARIPVRPGTSQGFAQTTTSSLGTFKPSQTMTGHGTGGVAGMSRRNVKSLPGWKQFFDNSTSSFYWVNTRDHTSQWQHPTEKRRSRKEIEKFWDGQKAEVKLRADKVGIVIGAADHWLPEYQNAPRDPPGRTALQTKQTVLAMLHRWSQKWGKISEAFRGMDIKANGEIDRSQLRTGMSISQERTQCMYVSMHVCFYVCMYV